jgi:ElaB/YqjD/DUF883 family membrane-anchored ribosome-binding protein
MKRTKHAEHNNHQHEISEHARALVVATQHIAEEKVVAAREKLSGWIDSAKERIEQVEEFAKEEAKQADHFIREKPYQAVGLAVGIGFLLGIVFSRRK